MIDNVIISDLKGNISSEIKFCFYLFNIIKLRFNVLGIILSILI